MAPGPAKQFDQEEALHKAMDVFWAKGYEGASLSEILEQIGIGKKSLYDTFGNKRSLFHRAMDLYAQTQYGKITSILQRPGSPMANIRALLEHWRGMAARPDSRGCLLGTNMADFNVEDEDVAEKLRGYLGYVERAVEGTLEAAQEAGELGPDADCQGIAQLLVSLSQGMALIGRIDRDGRMPRRVVAAAMQLLQAA